MVCEQKIRELERQLGRKLSEKEKKKVREKLHHVEVGDDYEDENYENKELEVVA